MILGQRLLQKLTSDPSATNSQSAGNSSNNSSQQDVSSGCGTMTSDVSSNSIIIGGNADTRAIVLQHLEAVRSAQENLLQLWQHKRAKLDQCFQLRLFEQDCEKVSSYTKKKHKPQVITEYFILDV